MKTARRIAFLNCKGGVGKTSVAVNVAACLVHDQKLRVLLVDLDPQSNASIWLMGLPRWSVLDGMPHRTIMAAFNDDGHHLLDAIHDGVIEDENRLKLLPTLDMIPAIYDLMSVDHDHDFANTRHEPYFIRFYHEMEPMFARYDYIIFDCPPSLGRTSKCAVFTAEEIFVPANPDLLSNVGLRLLDEKITRFEKESEAGCRLIPRHRRSEIRGLILNGVNTKANNREAIDLMRTRIHGLRDHPVVSDDADILPVQIRDGIAMVRIQTTSHPLVLEPKTNPEMLEDFLRLTRYIHSTPLKTKARINEPKRKAR
ncbi:MAG: ParA family protein [Verrucomicrobiae bacterium]|nr:ParA family protein [Verrucomicrobiae bacterium]